MVNLEARIKKLEKHQRSEERGNTCLPIFVQYSESQKALVLDAQQVKAITGLNPTRYPQRFAQVEYTGLQLDVGNRTTRLGYCVKLTDPCIEKYEACSPSVGGYSVWIKSPRVLVVACNWEKE